MPQNISPTVTTTSGKLQGIYENGLYVSKGIPYAAPPVGELRWMPPQPVKPWPGIRPAEKFGTICPQSVILATTIPGRKPSEEPQNEDCLFLNVWTPSVDNVKRAVMVWVHGGAFTNGSGSSPMNPGETLPKRGGIVLVTINYRVGSLGFVNLSQVTEGKISSSGNEGLLDQIAALQWVRDNINAFGGDPDNVTVFGESAGAESIGALLAMPHSKGLFRKAILQSGASKAQPLAQATESASNLLRRLGLTGKDVKALREVPVEALVTAQSAPPGGGMGSFMPGPVQDGEILKDIPLDAVERGSARDLTVLAGSNLEEAKLFAMMMPDVKNMDEASLLSRVERLLPKQHAAKVIAKYRTALARRELPVTPYEIYVAIMGDQHFRMPNIRLCEYQEKLGKPAFGYVFNWKSVVPGLGACHALDVGFIFGNLTREFQGDSPAAQKLALQMQDAWTAFAKTGNPSTPELAWPSYGKDRNMMVFEKNSHVETSPYEGERAAWEGIENKWLG